MPLPNTLNKLTSRHTNREPDIQNAKICIASWNVGGVKEAEINGATIKKWIDFDEDSQNGTKAEIYVLNFQEFRDLNAPINYLPSNMEKHLQRRLSDRQSREDLMTITLDKILEDYQRVANMKLVGLHSYVYIKEDYLINHRIQKIEVAKLPLGAFDVIGNKGAILVTITINFKRCLFANVHLAAGSGLDKFESRMKQLGNILTFCCDHDSFQTVYEDESNLHHEQHLLRKLTDKMTPEKRDRIRRFSRKAPSRNTTMKNINDKIYGTKKIIKKWDELFDFILFAGDFNFRGLEKPTGPRERRMSRIAGKGNASEKRKSDDESHPANMQPELPTSDQNLSVPVESSTLDTDQQLTKTKTRKELWEQDEFKLLNTILPDNPINQFFEAHDVKPKSISLPKDSKRNSNHLGLRPKQRNGPPFNDPTYKYMPKQGVLDPNRTPAWTDRIIVAKGQHHHNHEHYPVTIASLNCAKYTSIKDIIVSDHLPILAKFNLLSLCDR